MKDQHSMTESFIGKFLNLFKNTVKAPENIQQLQRLISQSDQNGLLPHDVASMVTGVLQVSEMRVRDIMIPRSQMTVLDINDSTEDYLGTIVKTSHSRFPVIDESMDKVTGVLLAKDLLHWSMNQTGEGQNFKLKEVLRTAIFVPESKRLNVMLKEFRDSRNHLALVVDEYGGTTGLVTIEDVLEQIVGDISDEHDVEEANYILQHSDVRHTVKAQTTLEDFNEYFKSDVNHTANQTIGGFVVNALGHLPKRNEVLEIPGFRFKILHADKRRVHLLQVNII